MPLELVFILDNLNVKLTNMYTKHAIKAAWHFNHLVTQATLVPSYLLKHNKIHSEHVGLLIGMFARNLSCISKEQNMPLSG